MGRAEHAQGAAAWIICRENGDWPDKGRAAFDGWLASIIGVGTFHYSGTYPAPTPVLATMRYDTPVKGAQRTIPPADGSWIELNTKTVVRTAVSK